ncbi:peptidoglycan-binding protein [Oscillatoria sp. FACHB-1407]|uniref:peptidoglycan-binding domain-containing protein n=1 Tax=Oscillatoria sp. FACHB-1407 TaxID=2692847 RepID=UPI001684B106|nr:peptidoglycan-binding domain-containing protein [Oscillatoria sp. FACHB-1407]MBD2463294.1 peptidoglycan-binding protein [Oscillatoria sp. FACHB-1407]
MVYSLSQFKAVLNGLGYNLGPDGHGGNYGNLLDSYTQAAIYEFQTEHRLPSTGVLDSATIEKARQLVRNLQHSLNLAVNAQLPVNEFYGVNTVKAVMQFQKTYDLPITGIAGYAVRKCLDNIVKQQLRQQLNSQRVSV